MLTKLRDSLAITWSRETLGHSQALPSLFLPSNIVPAGQGFSMTDPPCADEAGLINQVRRAMTLAPNNAYDCFLRDLEKDD
jgi:hypothetical protein